MTSNEEKGTMFCHMFFPEKPADSLIPLDAEYPDHMNYSFRASLEQLRRCTAKLSPHKAPGEDGIPNVVLKELMGLIDEYLLHIFKAVFHARYIQ